MHKLFFHTVQVKDNLFENRNKNTTQHDKVAIYCKKKSRLCRVVSLLCRVLVAILEQVIFDLYCMIKIDARHEDGQGMIKNPALIIRDFGII